MNQYIKRNRLSKYRVASLKVLLVYGNEGQGSLKIDFRDCYELDYELESSWGDEADIVSNI